MANFEWSKQPIRNVLLDINGVLYDSGDNHAINGSVRAMQRLVDHGFKFCLVTNNVSYTKKSLAALLNSLGFDCVTPSKIVCPSPTACNYIEKHKLRPRLHISDSTMEDFQPVIDRMQNCNEPLNCLVVGDPVSKITNEYMDESLELMLSSPELPKIIALGSGRYYKGGGKLRMDTGGYVAAFEYCLGVKAINCGKPSEKFFREALDIVGATSIDTVMIGDDVVSDVGGAQEAGMRAFLVRTGKYRSSDETDTGIIPDCVFDNLAAATEALISSQSCIPAVLSD